MMHEKFESNITEIFDKHVQRSWKYVFSDVLFSLFTTIFFPSFCVLIFQKFWIEHFFVINVSDNQEVAEVFNEFFVNVARDIGKDYIFDKKNHPSLKKILNFVVEKNAFEFVHTNENFVSKVIDKFNGQLEPL
jgi:hypothetical protein